MYKSSTPGDREYMRKHLPIVMTKLELKLPLSWNTTVAHIFMAHTVDILEAAGPYCSANMLDVERYHTNFKKKARATNDIMASIKNSHLLEECANQNRLMKSVDWSFDAPRSSPAGAAARADSSFKQDRCISLKGASKKGTLSRAELSQVQDLWGIAFPEYAALRDRFRRFNRHRSRSKQVPSIAEWQSSQRVDFSSDERKWKTMTGSIEVIQTRTQPLHSCIGLASVYRTRDFISYARPIIGLTYYCLHAQLSY